jgi:hypothetical protein
MEVQRLRSCYETDCVFYSDSPLTARIRWYFVPEGTPLLPFGTAFTSNAWLDEPEGDQDIGEVPGADRTWVDGSPPYPVDNAGPPCGTADQFANGALVATAGAPLNVFGGVACCPLPPEPFIHYACGAAPDGLYSVYTAIPVGGDPLTAWAPFLGDFLLPPVSPCEYQTGIIGTGPATQARWHFDTVALPGTGISLNLEFVSGPLMTWVGVMPQPWDGVSAIQVPVATSSPAGAPTSVWIVPGPPGPPGNNCVILGHALPLNIVMRVAPITWGVIWGLGPGDYPFAQTSPCTYAARLWWRGLRFPGLPRITWRVASVAGVLPGPQMSVLLQAPDGTQYLYLADPGDWDGVTPITLLRQPGFTLLGVPDFVLLFNPDFPP